MKDSNKLKLIILILVVVLFCFFPTYTIDSLIDKKEIILDEYLKNKDNNNYSNNTLVVKIAYNNNINEIENKYNIKMEELGESSYVVKFDSDQYTVDEILNELNNEETIKYAEPDYYFELAASPNTELYYNQQWALKNTNYGVNFLPIWDQIRNNQSVVVAVVDTGIKYNHPDLVNNIWHNPNEIPGNLIDDDNNGYVDDYYGWDFANNSNNVMDTNGHGTHVAGIIGADINDIGIAGIVPNVKIMALKVISDDGNIYLSNITNAINYAISKGVKIFNFSFGNYTYVQTFRDLIQEKDALFICAAGNGGQDEIGDNNDSFPFYPASYDLNNIISVAAIGNNGNLATFSNYGKTSVDIAAPGVDIISTYKDDDYAYSSGTSMAAPFVTALTAILYGSDPDASILELKNNVLKGVKTIGGLNNKVVTNGIINIKESYNAFMDIVEFDGGTGTTNNPYLISSVRQLNAMRKNLSASYKLTKNIDLTDYNWLPIGTSDNPFTGTFNGGGYKISNLSIDGGNNSYQGLFGYVIGSSNTLPNMYNVQLQVNMLKGKNYLGSFIGYGEKVNISNVKIITTIESTNSNQGYIGGLIGYGLDSKISNSSVQGIITSNGNYLGGIAGYFMGDIILSYNTANLYGGSYMGGLAGYLIGNIEDAYNLGLITADDTIINVGGMVGYLEGNINNTYYLGLLNIDDTITYENVGLIVGNNNGGTITNSYYYNPYGVDSNIYGTEITIDDLYTATTYAGFNFTNDWTIGANSLLPTIKNVSFDRLNDFTILEDISVNKNDPYDKININTSPNSNKRYNYLFTSDNPDIVIVDKKGTIIPKQIGTTTIRIYAIELNITKTINITVEDYIRGDLNNDRNITTTDLVILRRYLAGLDNLSDIALKSADINKDKLITLTDLVRIRRYLAGLEDL